MITIGLTGGIACGKSTVAGIFKEAGAIILDADIFARRAVMPGEPAWRAVRDIFGTDVLNKDGTIDRVRLGHLVFDDPRSRRRLEQIIHPHVRDHMMAELVRLRQCAPHAVVIQDIPLLFETGMTQGLMEIIVVYAPAAFQLKRLILRDGLGVKAARARINAQMSIEEKCRRATIIINNSGTPEHTKAQVLKVFAEFASLARKGSKTAFSSGSEN